MHNNRASLSRIMSISPHNTSLFRTQASLLYLAHLVSHGKGTPYLARFVCPSIYGCCPHHSGAWGRKLEKFHLPGFCDRLIGSFTFSRTQNLPTELFVIFIMICDMFNRALGITEIMHFNRCPSSCRDWFKRTYKLPASFLTKRTVFSTSKHCFWSKNEFFY